MEFGTWYQINCEGEDRWREDLSSISEAGFDFVVLWNMLPATERSAAEVRLIVSEAEPTLRALDEVARAGLAAYLGIWHPHSMGRVRPAWRPQWSNGLLAQGPNIFNEQWLRTSWQPYVQAANKLCASHPACRGVFLDDTFPAMPSTVDGYLSYSAADRRRFRLWLAARYGSASNLNMTHWLSPGFRSFAAVQPPHDPLANLALWTDWMQARDEWCEDFIATARHALAGIEPAGRHVEFVLSDHDYHIQCTPLQYGVDYSHLMPHIDRLETYMAPNHTAVSPRDLLSNVRRIVRRGVHTAGGKPFLFHTWFADRATLQPMNEGVLSDVIATAAEEGASAIEVYTYKVHDWRVSARTIRDARRIPALREASLKYHPELLAAITRTIRHLKGPHS